MDQLDQLTEFLFGKPKGRPRGFIEDWKPRADTAIKTHIDPAAYEQALSEETDERARLLEWLEAAK